MKSSLIALKNITEPHNDIDLLIVSATGEPRSWYFLEKIHRQCKLRWFIPEFNPRHSPFEISDSITERDILALPIERYSLKEKLQNFFRDGQVKPVIAVDISCMSRPVMAEVFQELFSQATSQRFKIVVLYSIAEYTPPPNWLPVNEDIRPVSSAFAGWPHDSAASTSLIVGLGYEKNKAEGACEYFDPSEVWVFVPHSPLHEFDADVLNNNQELVGRESRHGRELAYPVNDPERTFGSLVATVTSLISRSNPLILPFGPKIFFALSLLVAELYEEVGVWLVTGDLAGGANDHNASDFSVCFEFELGSS